MQLARRRCLEANPWPRTPSPSSDDFDFSSPRNSDSSDSICIGPWTPLASITDSNQVKEFTALPLEIWTHIIAWADPPTLAVLARVNTVAHYISTRHLYNNISLPKQADSTKLLDTLSSSSSHDYSSLLKSLDIPINASNCKSVNQVIKSLPQLSILKLKVTGQVEWPFKDTNLDLCQFHWEVLQDKGTAQSTVEHGGGPKGLSNWLQTQQNIIKLKLVTHERICVPPDALKKLVRASGPMFIVSNLVPGRPVDTVQVTPRSRDATVGMGSLGLSTGPLKHLKIVSRVDHDHHRLLNILSESNPFLETLSFELCGQLDNLKTFLDDSLFEFPPFPELQSLSFCPRSRGPFTPMEPSYYRLKTEAIQKRCPKLHRVYLPPGIMATLQPCPRSSRRARNR